jgi:eukaryotic-like serine/threonine-protein kinase
METDVRHIAQYALEQRLGGSARGEVWKASDPLTQHPVAIKRFHADLQVDAEAMVHYMHTMQALAALHHPGIVRIRDVRILPSPKVEQPAAQVWLVMEYVEGGHTLADSIRNTSSMGKMPLYAELLQLFTSISLSLDAAYQRGVIHSNLKPTNILLNTGPSLQGRIGKPLLTDFGLASLLRNKTGSDKPFYLSPEQIRGAAANERSDVYALGAILYELCTGVPPFRGNRPIAVMMQHLDAPPTPPALMNPTISPALTAVILRCLAKDPAARFASASSFTIALARALNLPIPEELRLSTAQPDALSWSGIPATPPSNSSGALSAVYVTQSSPTKQAAQPPPSFPPGRKRARRRSNSPATLAIIALLLLVGGALGTLLLVAQHAGVATNQGSGHVFFVNSGQLNDSSNQGINDEVQIDLSGIPDPAPGKSYYAWLLADHTQTESAPLLLDRLAVSHGSVHILYRGDQRHANLLGFFSRFLITEEDTSNPSSDPLLDQSTWRYYAEIPQLPIPGDKLQFSMLDHLRHLLVESPELSLRGLHGGLAFWFVRNTATVSESANAARDAWQRKDAQAVHEQAIRLLEYLDGEALITPDVPPGTLLPPADAHDAQIALLGPAPQDADPPGYAFRNEVPPGYVYLIVMHMNGAILSPLTQPEQRTLAIQINSGLDAVRRSLEQVYQDAKRLVHLTNAQLLQPSSLSLVDDLANQAQLAYAGQLDPSTGHSQGGALWVYGNLQRLATFDVRPFPYPSPSQ